MYIGTMIAIAVTLFLFITVPIWILGVVFDELTSDVKKDDKSTRSAETTFKSGIAQNIGKTIVGQLSSLYKKVETDLDRAGK